MRISWALQTAAVFCLVAVHPALAADNNNDNNAADSLTLESVQDVPALHFFQNFAAPDDTKVTLPVHTSNLLTRADDQDQKNSSESKHDRPRARPGPARSHTPHFEPGHEPRHRRPTGKPEPHQEKPHQKKPPCTTSTKGKGDPKSTKDPHHKPPCTTTTKGKGDPKPTKDPHHGKPPHHKPTKSTGKHKPTHKPSHKPKPKPHNPHKPHKPSKGGSSEAPKPTTVVAPPPATSDAPAVVPTPPVVAPSPPAVAPSPAANPASVTGGDSVQGEPSVAGPQPSTGLGNAAPNGTSKMSGTSSSSNLGTIMGATVGSVALVGLLALGVYRRKERRRSNFDEMGGPMGPDGAAGVGMGAGGHAEMDEAPRTAFRHESFMALVKDAAQGFYAPGTTSPGPGPSPLSAAAGAGAGAADLSRQTSARSQNSQRSLPYRRSGNFSGHGVPPSTLPPLAHLGGRS